MSAKKFALEAYGVKVAGYADHYKMADGYRVYTHLDAGSIASTDFGGTIKEMRAVAACIIAACDEADAEAAAKAAQREAA